MSHPATLVLDSKQIQQKINRLAYQVFEDCPDDKQIIVAGIAQNGFILAKLISDSLSKISPLKITLLKIELDKKNPLNTNIKISPTQDSYEHAVVFVVDDVLNSGKTLMYGLRPFLDDKVKKIRTVVLADRSHKRFPVSADFTGISIATTLQERITVVLESGKEAVYLE